MSKNRPSSQQIADEYVEDYEFGSDGGEYTPSDWESELIQDAINGLIADGVFRKAIFREVGQQREENKARGVCPGCGCPPPEHWGPCDEQ
jgi:hypothetical protein